MTGQAGWYAPFPAVLCASVATWLLLSGRLGRRRVQLLAEGPAVGADSTAGQRWRRRAVRWPVAVRWPSRATATGWCVLAAGGPLALWGRSPLPLLAAGPAAWAVARWRQRREQRREVAARQDAVIAFCVAVAGEVRAGRQPEKALAMAGADGFGERGPELLAAARYGGDVPAALRAAAQLSGADGLRGVAACWQVAVDGGASLAAGLDRVADALRAERGQREELRAQLAGPRSTALVLAVLPLMGLLLGAALGADPLRVLLHDPVGLGCLLAGCLLEWAGLAWVGAIIRSAERVAR